MGGAVSELRGAIHTHVVIAQHYPLLLEPCLAAVQFFLRTAESGEGADRERPLDDISTNEVMTNHCLFEEASTEVELLVENTQVMRVLLHTITSYAKLELSPLNDPFNQWYDPPWRVGKKPMPKYVEVPDDQVPRFRIAVLRCSMRCLRLMMFCTDGRSLLEELNGPQVLDQAARENPLDDYIKNDVKAIFKAVYGGDNAVRRIAIGDLPIIVEMLVENRESAIVQLAGVERVCDMLATVNALMYVPSEAHSEMEESTKTIISADDREQWSKQKKLFEDLETHGIVQLLTESLNRFDVDRYLLLYLHVCRFIAYVATDERNAKLVGQCGGIEGSIRLLFKAREMYRGKRFLEKQEQARLAKIEAEKAAHHDWAAIVEVDTAKPVAAPPPPTVLEGGTQRVTTLESLAVIDFTPSEIGQQAMWALDLLASVDFNVAQMKRHRLKYLLEEIRLDPDQHALGAALIITRRLRLIRWDQIVGLPEDDINMELSSFKKGKPTKATRKT